jgi:hypothetical protein
MANAMSGLTPLAGINIIKDDAAFATPEQRSGGTADPYHGNVGEQAKPYAWESRMTPGGSHGPYGPENQLLDDEFWFMEPSGMASDDPGFDRNTPSLTRSHGSVHNETVSGPIPSQDEAINKQISQMRNHASDLGTSDSMTEPSLAYVKQDNWHEIWDVDDGHSDLPEVGKPFSHQANGFGVNDAASNASRKINLFGYGSWHKHRRYAQSPIPGNYMWMRPQGRILFKTMAGPARPAVGGNSPFAGQDIGAAYAYDNGAVLQTTPTEYIPPPSPNIESVNPAYTNDQGTDGFDVF